MLFDGLVNRKSATLLFMHTQHLALPSVPCMGPMGVGGMPRYDSDGRLRLPRSDDKLVYNEYGSPDGPTHPPVTFPPEWPSWLLLQQRRALANSADAVLYCPAVMSASTTPAEAASQPPKQHPELAFGSQPGVVPDGGQLELGQVLTDRGYPAKVHTSDHVGG